MVKLRICNDATRRIVLAVTCLIFCRSCDAFTAPLTRAAPLVKTVSLSGNGLVTGSPVQQQQQQRRISSSSSRIQPLQMAAMAPPGVLEGAMQIVQDFSKSSLSSGGCAKTLLNSITQKAITTPPLAYFVALMAAGCGVPVSEDALCLFAGVVWPTLSGVQQRKLFGALYLGVVVSDVITFWIGRALRLGVFAPLQARLVGTSAAASRTTTNEKEATLMVPSNSTTAANGVVAIQKRRRKRDRIKNIAENTGDWVGFVIRFSVGTRGPLMLLTGFLQKVSFLKFFLGAAAGGLITVPLQLWLGYTLGHHNPAAMIGAVAGISTFVFGISVSVAAASWVTLVASKLRQRRAAALPLES